MAAFKLGAGGVVIAEGEPFKLNMARNAIIESSCPVWKRVKPVFVPSSAKWRASSVVSR